jgi:hypothetical protein
MNIRNAAGSLVVCVGVWAGVFEAAAQNGQIIEQYPMTYESGRPMTMSIPDPDSIQWENVQSRPGYRYRGMLPLHQRFHDMVMAKRRAGEPLTPGELDTVRLLQSVRRWPEAPVPGAKAKALMRYLRKLPTRDLNIAQSVMMAQAIHYGLYPVDFPKNSEAQKLVNYVNSGPFKPRNLFEWCFGRVEPWIDHQYATWGYDMRPPAGDTGPVFPASPFNGMQIRYSLAGAGLGASMDKEGFTTSRSLLGILAGNTLTLSGSASIKSGWGADVSVRLYAGSEERIQTNSIKNPGEFMFNLTVPRPAGTKGGGFSIDMVGTYSMAGAGSSTGTRGLRVSGTLEQSPEEKDRDDAEARKAWAEQVEKTLKELGYEDTPEGKRLKEMREAMAGGDQAWKDYVNRNLKSLGYSDSPEQQSFNEVRDALVSGGKAWSDYVKKTSSAAAQEGGEMLSAPEATTEEKQAMLVQSAWNFGSTAVLALNTPGVVAPGGAIEVNFSGIPADKAKLAWIGLFKVGDDSRKAIKDKIVPKADGIFDAEAPEEPGSYNVRLFFDESGQEAASTEPIEVKAGR